jgi:NADH:ubiquinone oxidoreductase subunit F (NADH-binding)
MSVPTLQTPRHAATTEPHAHPRPGHTADIPGHADVWHIGAPRLLAGLADGHRPLDARAHLSTHGPMHATDLHRLLTHLDAVQLTGRGGAGFPLATKVRALRGSDRTVIVNGSESEPASRKDRVLLTRSPHLVLDGALAIADAVSARRVQVAVHDPSAEVALRAALRERPDAGRVRIERIAGGLVSGEARAVVRGLSTGPSMPAVPPGRRELPTDSGRLVVNAETAAQVAVLLRMGWRRYLDTGTRTEPGTTLLTIGGAVARPGVVEMPLGTRLDIVLRAAGAVDPVAVVTGGYHGSWLLPIGAIELSRAGLAAAGGVLGAGVLIVLDSHTCALGELSRVTRWLAAQSAQQCGPCMFGLPALAGDVAALLAGTPHAADAAFAHVHAVTGRGACAHPDGTARFVSSALHVLQDEVDAHRRGGCGRPTVGQLPVGDPR